MNPEITPTPKNTWTKIATAITSGFIHIKKTRPTYFWTYRLTGETAPTDRNEGVFVGMEGLPLSFSDPTDVYIYSASPFFDGSVRFDHCYDPMGKKFQESFVNSTTAGVLDLHLMNYLDETLTLAANTSVLDETVEMTAGHGLLIGEWLEFWEGGLYLQTEVISVVTNTIGIALPIDFPFTTAATVRRGTVEMAIDATPGSPKIFEFKPLGRTFDVHRAILNMVHSAAGDDSKFGDITGGIPNGLFIRLFLGDFGIYQNLWNVKTNGDFRVRNFDVEYPDRGSPGFFGTATRRTFGGENRNGTVNPVMDGDAVQIIIRDQFSTLGLDSMKAVIEGKENIPYEFQRGQ